MTRVQAPASFVGNLRRHAHVVTSTGMTLAALVIPDRTEYWHYVGEPGQVGFEGGWENSGSGYNPLSYRRDDSGFVHLRGRVKAEPMESRQIFTLPAGWRPVNLEVRPCAMVADGATTGEVAPLYVRPTGEVEIVWASGPSHSFGYLGLDNVRWRAY